ncbi:hypothetical protein GBAR_LOCUS7308, partial [Geodia barretti]
LPIFPLFPLLLLSLLPFSLTQTQDQPDGTNLSVKNPPLLRTSDAYEEPLDVMKDDLSTFKDPVTPTSPLKKSPPRKRDSPQFQQKPKPSSSDSSPEPKRRGGSPRSPPHDVSPVTSPKEHRKFGFFSKKAKKKPVRSNSVKEGGRAGKAVLLPRKSNEEGAGVVATPSPLSSKKRPARPSLSLTSPPSSPSSTTGLKTSGNKHRTVSVSSTSTTGSETSPPAPKVSQLKKSSTPSQLTLPHSPTHKPNTFGVENRFAFSACTKLHTTPD